MYCCAGTAAAAYVDSENEKELTHEKTVIMIAHRLKTVRHADQILVVDKGQIVQQGTPDELDGAGRNLSSLHQWMKAVGRLEIAVSFPYAILNKKPTKGTATVYRVGFISVLVQCFFQVFNVLLHQGEIALSPLEFLLGNILA